MTKKLTLCFLGLFLSLASSTKTHWGNRGSLINMPLSSLSEETNKEHFCRKRPKHVISGTAGDLFISLLFGF